VTEGRAEVVIDAACRAELERVLAYPLGRSVDVAACLERCDKSCIRIEGHDGAELVELPQCRDPDDQKFLTLAAAARADCLVSRDRELLRLARRCAAHLAILPPGAFPVN